MVNAVITNLTTDTILATQAQVAIGPCQRMIGLLSRKALAEGEGMIFPRCRAIHTGFMRFAIDVLFVNTAARDRMQATGHRTQAARGILHLVA